MRPASAGTADGSCAGTGAGAAEGLRATRAAKGQASSQVELHGA